MTDRYDTTGNTENEYYPETSVLINLADIRDPEELLERETELQLAAYANTFSSFDERVIPDLPFFYELHRSIFGSLFAWAGRPRSVGISKGGTPFCAPANIEVMMKPLFEELRLEDWLSGLDLQAFTERTAYLACEINAIHPFREGNGRAIRFYLDVLSVRVRGDLFDWTLTTPEDYLRACVAGFEKNYDPMTSLLRKCAS
jgi:cell filamentation protein